MAARCVGCGGSWPVASSPPLSGVIVSNQLVDETPTQAADRFLTFLKSFGDRLTVKRKHVEYMRQVPQ